jgi:uncharacterized protein YjbI with pentapeptide repeats
MAEPTPSKQEAKEQAFERPQYRNLSKQRFKEVLEFHRRFLESNERDGQRADFSLTNLQKANLAGLNLKGANFRKANLQDADLRKANLQEANLRETDLRQTYFRDANLQHADLSDAENLMPGQLARANVSNAKLPKEIQEFKEVLEVVAETSKNSRKLFVVMLLGCAYVLLSIATTTDVRLLTNSGSSPLPIIGAQIPIVLFYLFSPFLLLGMYCYFHIYTQNLWEGLSELPAVFPDGRPLDMKAYPWLLTRLVRTQFYQLQGYHPPLSKLQKLISFVLAWMLVPLTMLCLWFRYVPRQDWIGTTLHIVIFTVAVWVAVMSYRLAMGTLREDKSEKALWENPLKQFRMYKRCGMAVCSGLIVLLLSLVTINGTGIYNQDTDRLKFELNDVKTWVPYALGKMRLSPFANLVDKEVSTKLSNWSQKEEEIWLVKSAPLYQGSLRSARAVRAFLVKADLRDADLRHTCLLNADLQGADLSGANLEGAKLGEAKLRNAKLIGSNPQRANFKMEDLLGNDSSGTDLRKADLLEARNKLSSLPEFEDQKVDFTKAKLQNADLTNANFPGAYLGEADLLEAKLNNANLLGADLWSANLASAELKGTNLRGAHLEGANLLGASLGGANLEGADLAGADLLGADLGGANLNGANLEGARLKMANLGGADLGEAKLSLANLLGANLEEVNLQEASLEGVCLQQAEGLTVERLSKAKTLYKAKFDPNLMKQIKNFHGHLLEEPSGADEYDEIGDPCQTGSGHNM